MVIIQIGISPQVKLHIEAIGETIKCHNINYDTMTKMDLSIILLITPSDNIPTNEFHNSTNTSTNNVDKRKPFCAGGLHIGEPTQHMNLKHAI